LFEVLLHAGEQRPKRALAASKENVQVPRLRRSRPKGRTPRQSVAVEYHHAFEMVGERPRGGQPPIPAPTTIACLPNDMDILPSPAFCGVYLVRRENTPKRGYQVICFAITIPAYR
jgi:hypothetical protein